jgi:rhodanese-related sulfurtransferase
MLDRSVSVLLIALVCLPVASARAQTNGHRNLQTISEQRLSAEIATGKRTVIVDARMPAERAECTIKCLNCAVFQVPYDLEPAEWTNATTGARFAAAVRKTTRLNGLRAVGQPVYVVCNAGVRAAAAASVLRRMGFKPIVLDGGLGLRNTSRLCPPQLQSAGQP